MGSHKIPRDLPYGKSHGTCHENYPWYRYFYVRVLSLGCHGKPHELSWDSIASFTGSRATPRGVYHHGMSGSNILRVPRWVPVGSYAGSPWDANGKAFEMLREGPWLRIRLLMASQCILLDVSCGPSMTSRGRRKTSRGTLGLRLAMVSHGTCRMASQDTPGKSYVEPRRLAVAPKLSSPALLCCSVMYRMYVCMCRSVSYRM